jgi:hypothetical protein
MSVGQTLSTPLLSNLLDHECDECDEDYYDEEEGCMPCSLKIVASNKELDGVSGDASRQSSWWNGNCVTSVVLYVVLFLQLVGLASCMAGAEDTTTTGPHWAVVHILFTLLWCLLAMPPCTAEPSHKRLQADLHGSTPCTRNDIITIKICVN